MISSLKATVPYEFIRRAVLAVTMSLLLVYSASPVRAAVTGTGVQRWLIVSDIHVDPLGKSANPKTGHDSSPALVTSAIAQMRRIDPQPRVIVIAGDYLAHAFDQRRAIPTMVAVARQFNLAFPATQFVLVLGNEDSDCGDYAVAT
ncbi:MAG: hypothetical protein IAI50_10550, partial [Candidatus Eremiobacteraeota bacterium]|nr:hypothetical protein [Candidatus Eremiobacteraeota bacterium]